MQNKVQSATVATESTEGPAGAIEAATGRPTRASTACSHTPPRRFQPSQPLSISIAILSAEGDAPASSTLVYRHVNQAERWTSVPMQAGDNKFTGAIPPEYTQGDYPLQYYFELEDAKGLAWLFPGFNKTLSNQPYFAVSTGQA